MKKSILALVALFGIGAMCWAQNTSTGTGTTNSATSSSTTPANTSRSTGTDLNGTTPSNGTNSMNTTSGNSNTGTNGMNTSGTNNSSINPGGSNTTGTLQSGNMSGTDFNSMQDPNGNMQGTMQSTGNYAAYGTAASVPSNLQTNLQTTYPSAFSPTWEQRGDWYRASFNNMNRNMQVYYAPNGDNYTVALPVTNSFVPEEVVTKALGMYGNNVYSINRVRGNNGLDNYQVTIIENGLSRTEFIGEDGATVAAVDVFRGADSDMGTMNNSSSNAANADLNGSSNMSGSMNGSNTNSSDMNSNMTSPSSNSDLKYKHKVETKDGRELKIKTKNGKTKVKGDTSISPNANGGM